VSLLGTAIEPVERLVRASLLLLDGGVLLRIDPTAAVKATGFLNASWRCSSGAPSRHR